MFKLEIQTDNAAFGADDGEWHCNQRRDEEVARIVRDAASRLLLTGDPTGTLRDHNGNTVGSYAFAEPVPVRDAAPEMLAALREIAALEPKTKIDSIGLLKRARHLSKIAIAKAEGRSNG